MALDRNPTATGWLILIILALVWGSSFILIKKGLVVLAPGEVGALRIISASVFLAPLAIRRLPSVNWKHIRLLFIVGLAGSLLPAFLYAEAQTRIDSSIAGVLNALTPIFVLLIGLAVFRKAITRMNVIGVITGFSGTALLIVGFSADKLNINSYAFLAVLATVCYGVNVNLIKYRIEDLSASSITSISMLLAGPIALAYLLVGTDYVTKTDLPGFWISSGAVVILGVAGTAIALILFNKLVKITTPLFSSSVTYLIPIVALLWGLWDGEQLFANHYLGMVIILLGVFIARK